MKAHLIRFEFVTRVIVNDDATEEDIAQAGFKNMEARLTRDLDSELTDNYKGQEPDTEMPFADYDRPGDFGYYANKK